MKTRKNNVLKKYNVILDPIRKHQRVQATIRIRNKLPTTILKLYSYIIFLYYILKLYSSKIHITRKVNMDKVQQLSTQLEADNVNNILDLTDILLESAKTNKTKGKIHKFWFDDECKQMKARNVSLMKLNQYTEDLHNLKKEYINLLKTKRSKYEEQEVLKKCIKAKTKPWEMFESPKKHTININMNTLQEHFYNLLNTQPTSEETDFTRHRTDEEEWYNEKITTEEIKEAMNNLKNNKAAGPDQSYNEHLKISYEYFQDWWLLFLNMLLETETIPNIWRNANLKVLYKGKGDISDPNAYRGIALLNSSYKLYTKIINNKIMKNIDTKLPDEQYGFRRERNCQEAIEILRTDVKKSPIIP